MTEEPIVHLTRAEMNRKLYEGLVFYLDMSESEARRYVRNAKFEDVEGGRVLRAHFPTGAWLIVYSHESMKLNNPRVF